MSTVCGSLSIPTFQCPDQFHHQHLVTVQQVMRFPSVNRLHTEQSSALLGIHFDDKVAIGWGGNLATTNPSSSETYLNTDTGAYLYYSAAHSENPINAGYTFTYARQRGDKILKSGTVQLGLYQNVRQGIASKIITIYGPVSYTHLDVYKRQVFRLINLRKRIPS